MSKGTIKLVVNSDQSMIECDNKLLEMYKEFKYLTISVRAGVNRSEDQNRLQRMWLNEAESQGDMTAEEYRGYCKLHFGVVIRKEDEGFAAEYDKIFKPLPYEMKLALMMEPFDFPVTRKMTVSQKCRYLDKIYEHFTGLGMRLTEPER